MSDHEEKDFLSGIVIGGILGATAAVLLGTDEGKEIRKKLKKKGQQFLKELPDMVQDVEEKITDVKDTIAEETKEVVTPAVHDLQKRGRHFLKHLLGSDKK